MSKHTPGPWHYIYRGQETACDPEPHGTILEPPWVEGKGWHGYSLLADVRLIAAAPEMLEALKDTLSWLSSYPGGGAAVCYEKVRAVIAKAETA